MRHFLTFFSITQLFIPFLHSGFLLVCWLLCMKEKPFCLVFPSLAFPVCVCARVRACSRTHTLSHFSYVQLCNSMIYSPPGSSVHRILQARILGWIPMPSFRGSFQPRDQTRVTCVSCIAGGFFTTGKAHRGIKLTNKNCINCTVWWFYISIYCEVIILIRLNNMSIISYS